MEIYEVFLNRMTAYLDMPVILLNILEPLEVQSKDGGEAFDPHALVRFLKLETMFTLHMFV